MKLLFQILVLAVFAIVFSPMIGITPLVFMGVAMAVAVAVSFDPVMGKLLFGGIVNLTELSTELSGMFKVESGLPKKWFYDTDILLRKYAKRITQVNGKWIAPLGLMTNVVQGFSNSWTALGELKIVDKVLTPWPLKVNFPIDPTTIEGSYLSWANEETRKLEDRSMSRYIMEFLNEKIIDDINELSISGVYDAPTKNTVFGASMDGIVEVITQAVAATLVGPTNESVYLIKLAAATSNNIVARVIAFEKGIPEKMKMKVKRIFMSTANAEDYAIQYEQAYGAMVTHNDQNNYLSKIGKREIVGIPNAAMGDLIFAFAEGNLLELVDLNDVPKIHDVQVLNYEVKIFAEAKLGYDFAINAAVFVGDTTITDNGLQDADLNLQFYNLV